MATAWPDTLPDPYTQLAEEWDMPMVENTSEMGIDHDFPMYTTIPRSFVVTFASLTADEKEDMTDYFETIGWGGGDIIWTHPGTAATIYVRLKGPLIFQHLGGDTWTTTLRFKRVPDEVIT